eukprot:TRINITY_DN3654_c1_g2_i2.p1 TRINITY_DN3654_c1_g2~~TRINITY_DN3654_c1_g2_i2.p1  ORF type:complete len:162 (-),score=30.48 TRINITY_DN3654_c1_g2_i2:156-590(-)
MARKCSSLALAFATLAITLLCAPNVFMSAPISRGLAAAGVAASSVAWPAWAYDGQVMDVQMLLARVPGGKVAREQGLVVVPPEDDGFSDAQVALLFVVALVALVSAVDVARLLYDGINPSKFKSGKGNKGYITPLVKRLIEYGN